MFVVIAALALTLNLGGPKHAVAPQVTCGIKTVSYRFVGTPGAEFRYDGRTYRVPIGGSIELLADKKETTYMTTAGKSLPLDVWAADEFGTRTVPLPTAAPITTASK
ncbi:MAG TPA: hypothetical protein VGF69_12165 [Thermoanaerobaculia bacterium]|jgi:hypothetical protein